MMRKRETKPKAMWVYYLVAFAAVCLAFASLYGSGYLNPEEKPFANAFPAKAEQSTAAGRMMRNSLFIVDLEIFMGFSFAFRNKCYRLGTVPV